MSDARDTDRAAKGASGLAAGLTGAAHLGKPLISFGFVLAIWFAVTAAGCAALLAIGWAFLTIDASTGWLYPWGFVIIAAGASTSIVAATHPGSKGLPRLLGSGSMRWAGTRSRTGGRRRRC